ncbi:hypothetical protein N300_02466, partial [Calypte anna]
LEPVQLLHLILEDPDLIHEGNHPVCRHGGGVEPGGCQERSHVEGQRRLRRVEDEELAPAEPQQGHLVRNWELGIKRDIPSPFHGAEEEAGSQLADVVDSHHAALLGILGAVASGRVRFRTEELGD